MIPKPVDFRRELIPHPEHQAAVAGPFQLPGGWQTEHVSVGSAAWQLTIPANPDALLDEPDSTVANLADDRMPYWAFVWPAALPMAAAVLQADWQNNLPLLNLIEQMLEPDGECWLGDGGRSAAVKFWSLAQERGYDVEVRAEDGQLRETPVRDFQLFVIRRKGDQR